MESELSLLKGALAGAFQNAVPEPAVDVDFFAPLNCRNNGNVDVFVIP